MHSDSVGLYGTEGGTIEIVRISSSYGTDTRLHLNVQHKSHFIQNYTKFDLTLTDFVRVLQIQSISILHQQQYLIRIFSVFVCAFIVVNIKRSKNQCKNQKKSHRTKPELSMFQPGFGHLRSIPTLTDRFVFWYFLVSFDSAK